MIDIKNKTTRKVNMRTLTAVAQDMSTHAACLLTESAVRQYLDKNPDEFTGTPISIDDLVTGKITADEQALFMASCSKYNKVFATSTNTLPANERHTASHFQTERRRKQHLLPKAKLQSS